MNTWCVIVGDNSKSWPDFGAFIHRCKSQHFRKVCRIMPEIDSSEEVDAPAAQLDLRNKLGRSLQQLFKLLIQQLFYRKILDQWHRLQLISSATSKVIMWCQMGFKQLELNHLDTEWNWNTRPMLFPGSSMSFIYLQPKQIFWGTCQWVTGDAE